MGACGKRWQCRSQYNCTLKDVVSDVWRCVALVIVIVVVVLVIVAAAVVVVVAIVVVVVVAAVLRNKHFIDFSPFSSGPRAVKGAQV